MFINQVNVNFWLRRQRPCARKSSPHFGQCPMMFYIHANGLQSRDVATGYYCTVEEWDSDRLSSQTLQAQWQIRQVVEGLAAVYSNLNEVATGPMLLEQYQNRNAPPINLLAVAREYMESQRPRVERSTRNSYASNYQRLEAYIKKELKRTSVVLPEVKNAFLRDYEAYCLHRHVKLKRKGIGMSPNSVRSSIGFVKQVMDYAQFKDYIRSNPTRAYKVDTSRVKPDLTYLNDEELDAIRAHRFLNRQLTQAADVLLFLCEVGISHCDYIRLEDSWIKPLGTLDLPYDLRQRVDLNERWLIGSRKKTKVSFAVPLSQEALRLLNKYGGPSSFPRFSMSDINPLLRSVVEACGIDKYITSRVMRKTFANQWRNKAGLSSKAASRLLGHSSDLMVNRYAEVQIEAAVREVYAQAS